MMYVYRYGKNVCTAQEPMRPQRLNIDDNIDKGEILYTHPFLLVAYEADGNEFGAPSLELGHPV